MKKITALFLALIMCLSLTACGKSEAAKAVRVFRIVSEFGWILYVFAAIIVGIALASWVWEISPFYLWVINLLPAKVIASVEIFIAIWGFFALTVTLLTAAIKGLFTWLGSEKREARLYKRYYNKHLKIVNENKV